MMRAGVTLAAGLLFCSSANAGGDSVPTDRERIVVLGGELVDGDYQRFRSLTASANPDIVVLEAPYGKLDEALLIAAEIRRRNLNTFIGSGRRCGDACALIFLAGSRKFAEADSEIGILPASLMFDPAERSGTKSPIPPGVRARIGSAPLHQMYWLNEAEKREIGIASPKLYQPSGPSNGSKQAYRDRPVRLAAAKYDGRLPRPRPGPHLSVNVPVQHATDPHLLGEVPGVTYLSVPLSSAVPTGHDVLVEEDQFQRDLVAAPSSGTLDQPSRVGEPR